MAKKPEPPPIIIKAAVIERQLNDFCNSGSPMVLYRPKDKGKESGGMVAVTVTISGAR